MFYLFLLLIAALGVGFYLLFFFQNVPGAMEERLGVLEPLPDDLGEWKQDERSETGKAALLNEEVCEQRVFFDETRGKLLHQVRYRSRSNDEIVRVGPERVVKRRRIRRA